MAINSKRDNNKRLVECALDTAIKSMFNVGDKTPIGVRVGPNFSSYVEVFERIHNRGVIKR